MAERTCDVAIIGAGTAGLHAYKAARDAGADVLIIECGDGGSTCTHDGCIPSKALLAAARAAHMVERAPQLGVDAGPAHVDGAAVMRRLREIRDRANGRIVDEYCDIPEDSRLKGRARFTAPNTLAIDDGSSVRARSIIIATGAEPAVPPSLEPVRDLVHTHKTIFEIAELPSALAVVGAGPLGLELAQAFARLGVAVTVLDEGKVVGAIDDPEAERAAREALARDMRIVLGVEVAAEPAGARARVTWSGDESGEVVVDLILAATGRKPQPDALNLAAAGVPTDDDGVPTFAEETRRCGDTDVFAAGDVGGWRPVLHEAARGGRIAGRVAAGGAAFPPVPSVAIAFTEPNIGVVGTPFDTLPDGAIIGTAKVEDSIRAQVDLEEAGVVRLYADRDGRLIGGTIVAPDGEHLTQALALAIGQDMDAAAFADQPWYHPVIEELLQDAARDICRQGG